MKVGELMNVLRSYNPEYDFMICSEDDIWVVEQMSFREATLLHTSNDFIVEESGYNPTENGTVVSKRKALLIDLDI